MKFQPGQRIAPEKVLDYRLSTYQDAVLAAQETLDTLMLQLADLERQADDIAGVDASAFCADMRMDQTLARDMRARLNDLQTDLANRKRAAGLPIAAFSIRDPDEFL